MRGTRWLLLVAIAVIVSGVGLTYRAQRNAQRAHAGPKPAILPDELNSSAQNWTYTESNANHTTVEITAGDAKEARDSSRVDLKNVTLKLHNKHGETYDLVKSAQATYFKNEHRFYSDGDVEITLNIPEAGQPKHPPISIKSSGVNFDTTSGQADTDRASQFIFEHGTGQAIGASYDPTTHELRLKQDVKLDWLPVGPHAKPMKIEGASLLYQEASSEIWLRPWGKLTRENTVVEGENADIKLQEDTEGHKSVRSIQADHARGSDVYPNRKLQYAADRLWMSFNADGKIQAITGETNAQLVETSDASETTVTADHVDLNFDIPEGQESVLTSVTGAGHSTATARPLPVAGRALSETHVLKSDKLEMKMKPGGKEIATVTAPTPATLEFVPNQPVQHHRTLQGKDMLIVYGAQNHIESFHANDARIQTEPTDAEKKRNRTTSITTSKQIEAHFDPKTNSLVSMQQTGDFTYDEGDRKARAAPGVHRTGPPRPLHRRLRPEASRAPRDRPRDSRLAGRFRLRFAAGQGLRRRFGSDCANCQRPGAHWQRGAQ
jgi:lipopolysaccharide export system protein LptA